MKKPLAGRKWFYALGQRHACMGYRAESVVGLMKKGWPLWAITAYMRGQLETW